MRIGRQWCLPELSNIKSHPEFDLYQMVEGVSGAGFEIPIIDLESNNLNNRYQAFSHLLSGVDERGWLKVILDVKQGSQVSNPLLSRTAAIEEVGFIEKKLSVFFEQEQRSLFKVSTLRLSLPFESLKSLNARALKGEELRAWFKYPLSEKVSNNFLEMGSEMVGVLRLKKLTSQPIDMNTLALIQDRIPTPFQISVGIKKIASAKMDMWLRAKMNRDRFSSDVTSGDKLDASSSVLRDVSLLSQAVFEFEWILTLPRLSESDLRSDLVVAQKALSPLGDAYIETFGAVPSFIASRPGGSMHVTQKEVTPTIQYFLPLTAFGGSEDLLVTKPTTCVLHREDGSLTGFDLFNEQFLAYNTLITGKTGSGKSVIGNALSQAFLNDENVCLMKVDVGGSYKRECALQKGVEMNFHLNSPSGVDPFAIVGQDLTCEKLSILTELLATLAVEEGEVSVSKTYRSQFETALQAYFETKPKSPSLRHFLKQASHIARLEVLKRFGEGGVFENAIREREGSQISSRYIYFNFENIIGASNQDYAAGVMAAVIALINLRMLELSTKEARAQGKRLVFFCDETKFFIERNAGFFLLTTANFRKFGHAVVLSGQNIEDFYLKRNGEVDQGLVLNSPTRIFFESQVKPEFLEREFGLSERLTSLLGHDAYRGKEYRSFVLQDDLGTRAVRLYLTKKEYWSMTSSRSDVDRLDGLKTHLPWLRDDQAIELMALEPTK